MEEVWKGGGSVEWWMSGGVEGYVEGCGVVEEVWKGGG